MMASKMTKTVASKSKILSKKNSSTCDAKPDPFFVYENNIVTKDLDQLSQTKLKFTKQMKDLNTEKYLDMKACDSDKTHDNYISEKKRPKGFCYNSSFIMVDGTSKKKLANFRHHSHFNKTIHGFEHSQSTDENQHLKNPGKKQNKQNLKKQMATTNHSNNTFGSSDANKNTATMNSTSTNTATNKNPKILDQHRDDVIFVKSDGAYHRVDQPLLDINHLCLEICERYRKLCQEFDKTKRNNSECKVSEIIRSHQINFSTITKIFDCYEGSSEYLASKLIDHMISNPYKAIVPVRVKHDTKDHHYNKKQTAITTQKEPQLNVYTSLLTDESKRKNLKKVVLQMYEFLDLLKITYAELYYKRIENSYEILAKYAHDVDESEKRTFNYMVERSKDKAIEFIEKIDCSMYPRVYTNKSDEEMRMNEMQFADRKLHLHIDNRISMLNIHMHNVFNKAEVKMKPGAKSASVIKLCNDN